MTGKKAGAALLFARFRVSIELVKHKIWEYVNQRVKVNALGVLYRGLFKGADEDWVFLQTRTTWVQIPWLEITSFEPDDTVEDEYFEKKDFVPEPDVKKPPELKVIKGGLESPGSTAPEKIGEDPEKKNKN
jgi:hypothetical protein